MYRLALVLVLLVMLAGCGGSSDEDSNSAAPPAASSGASKVAAKKDRSGADSREAKGRAEAGKTGKEKDEKPSADGEAADEKPQSLEEALEAAPDSAANKLIRQAVSATLAVYDLELAGVDIGRGGRKVEVLITRGSACRAVARDEPVMAENIRRGAPIVKSVSFEVAATGQALGYYVLRCKRPEVPDGPGKVVLSREGVGGPITTREFRIRGKRWAIEYENGSSHLALLVLTDRKGQANDPIGSDKREVGRKVYNTGPGTYKLQIQGGGFWSVRVKDIR